MTFRRFSLLSSFLIMLLTPSVFGQTWQEQFAVVESLLERGEADSAKSVLEQAVALAETQYSQSDSTVDIEFNEDGVSYRLYYCSFSEAEQLYTRLVGISEKLYGSANHEFALHVRKLGGVYMTLGKYREAEATYRWALAATEHAFGPNSRQTVGILNDLGDVLCMLAEYEAADSVAQKALRIAQETLIANHPSVARSLQVIGQVLMSREAEVDAEPVLVRSLAIREDYLGPDHPDVAKGLRCLGECYQKVSKPDKAKTAVTRSLKIIEAALGPEHPEAALSLIRLARYQEGSSREQRAAHAFSVFEKTYGHNHPLTATALLAWAFEKTMLGSFEDAEAKARQALPVLEEAFGHNHPSVALAFESISISKYFMHQFADALVFLKQAEAILVARAIPNARLTTVLHYLFSCYTDMGLEANADSVLRRLDSMAAKAGNSGNGAFTSFSLGMIYLRKGRTAEGRDLLNRALAIHNNISSEDTELKMITLRTLAATWVMDHEYAKAESLVCRVLPKLEDYYGSESVAYTVTLGQLGQIYRLQGKLDLAKETFLSGLNIYERSRMLDSWEATASLFSLGTICGATGEYAESLQFFKRFLVTKQRITRIVFGSSSESQKVRHVSKYPVIFDEVFSLAAICGTRESRQLALEISLKEKAMVEEAAMVERRTAYCSYDSTIVNQLNWLKEVRTAVANLTLSRSTDGDSLRTLYDVHDSLETELSRSCAQFEHDLALHNFEVSDVAASIPEGAVLLELIKYRPVEFDSAYIANETENSNELHYSALTLDADGSTSIHDLGPADLIDSLVSLARELVYDAQPMIHSTKASVAETMLGEVTRQLRELVFDPLVPQLAGITSLYISPDGMLSLLPFEILPMPDSSYLIEKYRVSYLCSGRDLLRYGKPAEVSEDVVVMADPDFENVSPRTIAASSRSTTVSSPVSDTLINQLRGGEGCLDGRFGRLNHGLTEGKHVAESFRKLSTRTILEFYGQEASEANLKQMNAAPGVLHLATHGYFCPYSDDLSPNYENPLLRSGLVLAGYNSAISNEDDRAMNGEDGILTAFEVSALNLNGTELVTLSACESGMAEGGTAGDGFYGLRRAFQHAGAQTVVMSLWKVPDRETRLLMEGFYDRWLAGSTKQDALRDSALELLRTCREELGSGHPLLWGGFILTGNPN